MELGLFINQCGYIITGSDNLSAEHLQFCHPLVMATISRLLNLMLSLIYVPDAFGLGITIPIPKKNDKRNHESYSFNH